MAIFAKRYERKVTLDDTEELKAVIETTQIIDGHTEYVVRVQRGPFSDNTWRILRRYNDFVNLHKTLRICKWCPALPEKKFFGNMRPDFIAQRRLDLQEYLNQILMNPILASSLTTKKFIDPEQYMTPFHDLALQHASQCLRAEGLFTVGQSHGPIGWRVRKHYFKVTPKPVNTKHSPGHSTGKHHLIKSTSQSHSSKHPGTPGSGVPSSASIEKEPKDFGKDDYILAWIEYGPDKFVDDKEIHNVMKNIAGIYHPYILPIEYVASNDSGALVIRKFNKPGSLKDILCGSSPLNPFLSKYGNPKGRNPLPLTELALYGRQILEALIFLHSRGMPYGHIHSGNVLIIDGAARLVDIENFVLGVPSFYRPFFIQHSRINTLEAVEVYQFGHLLYEMAMGVSLQESYARQINDCPDSLKNLLESILLRDAFKNNLPTLEHLANHRFFAEHAKGFKEHFSNATSDTKPHFKMSTVTKEQLRIAVQKAEARLRDEQKSVKNQKRLVRVQELMTSEEKEKKSKQKAKLEQKQVKLRTQNSLQLHNGPPQIAQTMVKSDSVSSISSPQLHRPEITLLTPPPIPTTSKEFVIPPHIPPIPPNSLALPSTSGAQESSSTDNENEQRAALLDSICNFKRGGLRKVNSN